MLYDFYNDYVVNLIDPFLFMQLRGLRVDLEARDRIRSELVAEQEAAVKRVESASNRKLMANRTISNKALAGFLYEDLKLPVQLHPKTGKPTTDDDALHKLATKVPADKQALFNDVLEIRGLAVVVSTFLDVELDSDNRFRCSYNIAGTETGRLSSSGSPWWTGGNVQNWPRDTKAGAVRNIIIADPGYAFIYGDGEQAEARVVAHLAEDMGLINAFESGEDPYKIVAHDIFGTPLDQIKKDSEERQLAKSAVHGSHYGLGPRKFAMMISKPESVAKAIQNRYLSKYPGVQGKFQADIRRQLDRTRTLVTPFGRRRMFFERYGDDLFRSGYAHMAQSTVADWANMGILRLWRMRTGQVNDNSSMTQYLDMSQHCFLVPFVEPLSNQHDGILTQVPIEDLQAGINALRYAMTYPIHFPKGDLTIPVDIKVGLRWGSLQSAKDSAWIEEIMRQGGCQESSRKAG